MQNSFSDFRIQSWIFLKKHTLSVCRFRYILISFVTLFSPSVSSLQNPHEQLKIMLVLKQTIIRGKGKESDPTDTLALMSADVSVDSRLTVNPDALAAL